MNSESSNLHLIHFLTFVFFVLPTTIIFIILKLIGSIYWSWWIVISPVWISLILFVLITITNAIVSLIAENSYTYNDFWEGVEGVVGICIILFVLFSAGILMLLGIIDWRPWTWPETILTISQPIANSIENMMDRVLNFIPDIVLVIIFLLLILLFVVKRVIYKRNLTKRFYELRRERRKNKNLSNEEFRELIK